MVAVCRCLLHEAMDATMGEPRKLAHEQTQASATCGGPAKPEVK